MFSPVMASYQRPSEFSLVESRLPFIRFLLPCRHLDKNESAHQKFQSQPCQRQQKKAHPLYTIAYLVFEQQQYIWPCLVSIVMFHKTNIFNFFLFALRAKDLCRDNNCSRSHREYQLEITQTNTQKSIVFRHFGKFFLSIAQVQHTNFYTICMQNQSNWSFGSVDTFVKKQK